MSHIELLDKLYNNPSSPWLSRYPLEGGALAKELGLKKKQMTDLLTETDDSVSLMAYLKVRFGGGGEGGATGE